MRLTIVGSGYVGLVTGGCFAEMGNDVLCVDVDAERTAMLKQGGCPIYEPGLEDLLRQNQKQGRLQFTTDIAEGTRHGEIIFICVGTPPSPDGSTDLGAVMAVAGSVGQNLDSYKIVVCKSTVPVGTCRKVRAEIAKHTDIEVDVASNPEFLKEGAAVGDFFHPDRVIVGASSRRAVDMISSLYAPYLRTGRQVMSMSVESAELTKHAANAMLASRISFMNDIAGLCEIVGADVEEIRRGLAADDRVGSRFLFPGLGFGGSCFPKDLRSLAHVGAREGHPMTLVESVTNVNLAARERFLDRMVDFFDGDLSGRTLAVWGLSFKPRTDDVREAPSIWVVQQILDRWPSATIRAHDPVANDTARKVLGDKIAYSDRAYDILDGADGLMICTEWNQFRSPDFAKMKQLMKRPVIFDGRNLYDPEVTRRSGFTYCSVGRRIIEPADGQ